MKKRVKIIIISAVAVLLLAAASIVTFVFWGDRIANTMAITFKNPEDYYAWYLNRGAKKLEVAGDLTAVFGKSDAPEPVRDKGNYLIKLSAGLSGEDFIAVNAISGNNMEKLLVSLPDYRRDYIDMSEALDYEISDGRSISSLLEEIRKKSGESSNRDSNNTTIPDISLKYSDFIDKVIENTTEVSLKKGEKEFKEGEKRTFNTISATIDGISLLKAYQDFNLESYIPEDYLDDVLETKYYLDIKTDKAGRVLELRFTINVKGSDYSLKLTPDSIGLDSDEGAVVKVKAELTMNLVGLIEMNIEARVNNGQLNLGLDVCPQKLVAAFLGEKDYKLQLALSLTKNSESYTSVDFDTTVLADGDIWLHLNVNGSEIPDSSIPNTGYTISNLLTSDYLDLNAAVGYLLYIVDRLPQDIVDELMETVSSEIGINISIDMIRNLYESGMLSLISGLLKSFGGNGGPDIGSILGGGLAGGIGGLGGLGNIGGLGGGLTGGLGSFGLSGKTEASELPEPTDRKEDVEAVENQLPDDLDEASEISLGDLDIPALEGMNNSKVPMPTEAPEETQAEEQGTPAETGNNGDIELPVAKEDPVTPEPDTENPGESEREKPTGSEDAAVEESENESDTVINTEMNTEKDSGAYSDEDSTDKEGASDESETNEVDVDALIAAFLDSYRDKIESSEKPQSVDYGDIVTIDIIPILFGEPFLDMAQYGFRVRMGDNFFGQDLDERFFGVAVGESKEVYAVLDEDFGDLAGLGLDFIVTLTDIKRYIKPEWSEAFIVDILGYESLDACLESIIGAASR